MLQRTDISLTYRPRLWQARVVRDSSTLSRDAHVFLENANALRELRQLVHCSWWTNISVKNCERNRQSGAGVGDIDNTTDAAFTRNA